MPKRYNLFIDAQNVPPSYIEAIIRYCNDTGYEQEDAKLYASPTEIAKILRRTGTLMAENDIDPVPILCKPGKNSVDIAIAVDVIEEACEDRDDDAFIIVTNDSDFTHVASRVISYKSEFHLLYTGRNKPKGYSPKAIIQRLEIKSSEQKISSQLKQAVKALPGGKSATRLIGAIKGDGRVAPYEMSTPMKKLPLEHFARRISECSPVAVDSKCLFVAYKEFTGRRWKGEGSKKTAQRFFDEQFSGHSYKFVQLDNASPNVGYFVSASAVYFSVQSPQSNELYSLVGADDHLLRLQAEALAAAISARDHSDYKALYESCSESNVMPSYGAWALLRGWYQATGIAKAQQHQQRPVPRQDVDAEALLEGYHASVRLQMEQGELAFVIAPSASAEAA